MRPRRRRQPQPEPPAADEAPVEYFRVATSFVWDGRHFIRDARVRSDDPMVKEIIGRGIGGFIRES
jgi:hypothetical protein